MQYFEAFFGRKSTFYLKKNAVFDWTQFNPLVFLKPSAGGTVAEKKTFEQFKEFAFIKGTVLNVKYSQLEFVQVVPYQARS